ncbi:MAG: elongation factor EF-2 [Euryarchaeota archaeon HGW-Euryarchaeota-1]|nr:MAG: elongation factor EF-2 [Euryarchaeota archaeon HGW-Euryarchaeota-1]
MANLEEIVRDAVANMSKDITRVRNIATIAHIDHGKTTFSDSLLSAGRVISDKYAGEQCAMSAWDVEQQRGITILASAITMVLKNSAGDDYLVNLIDTPGHVDFGGAVTRSMRAIDGAMVLVDSVDGIMPQTETVLKTALSVGVKPILYINKVDRLINELKITPEQMQERFIKIINGVNNFIAAYQPEGVDWRVSLQNNTVMFGSAKQKWGISMKWMKKTGITFKQIIDLVQQGEQDELAQKMPLSTVVFDSVVENLPCPRDAQKIRIPLLWKRGDPASPQGQAMLAADSGGSLMAAITSISSTKYGNFAYGRVFSGILKQGEEVYLNKQKQKAKIQQIAVQFIDKRVNVEEVRAGGVFSLSGLKDILVGETISLEPTEEFENITHLFEPVVVKAFEAKNPLELPALIDAIAQEARDDPTYKVELNRETGQQLVYGLGELHLDILQTRLKERGIEVKTSEPLVVYRESIEGANSLPFQARTPNKHNDLFFSVRPLPEPVYKSLVKKEIPQGNIRKKDTFIFDKLKIVGYDSETSKRARYVQNDCLLFDMTHGIVQMDEVIELIKQGFVMVVNSGPQLGGKMMGVEVQIVDAKLHEDAIHRGPAQVYPAVKEGIGGAILNAKPCIYEPIMKIRIDTQEKYIGDITKLLNGLRGTIENIDIIGEQAIVYADLPIAESFGFEAKLKSTTSGHGFFNMRETYYQKLRLDLAQKVVANIRAKKGLSAL